MAEEKTEKKEDLKKQLDSIAYELRQLHDKVERHSRNWVKAANTIMGDVGGKPGEAKHGKSIISVLIATAVTLLLAGSVFATVSLLDLTTGDGANNGTFTVISDEAGTATLTVDAAAVATVTVTTFGVTTLNVSGDVNASGNILGDDATIISNIATLAVDTIMSDGASLTIGDGTETLAINSSLVDLSTLGAFTGVLSATLTNGASIVATDSDTLTITETTIDLVGATVVDGITASGDVTANGNILGDDATIISNISIIAVDTIMSDGASLTLGDGTETFAINSSLTDLSTAGAFSGVLSVTLTNGASLVATDGDTLTITETTVDIVGATVVDGITASGDVTANGNILGDDATIISNIATIAVDTIMSDGASLTLGDGTETIAINSSLTDLSALGAFTGVLSIGLTNGASIVATDGDTLTITENDIDIVGALTVDGVTASGNVSAPTVSNDSGVVYAANGTFTNGLVVDARAPVLSFNTATYVTEVGTITMGSNGKYTNDWTTAFSAAPIVVLTYGEAVSTNTAYTTLLTTTNGVFNGTASVLMNFNATGLK